MLSDLLNLGCYVKKYSRLQMKINIAACTLGAALLFILVPRFMITGALVSLIIANLIRTLLIYYFSQQQVNLPYKFDYFYLALFAAVTFTWLGQIII
jgi:O-antigen/teichoic acid export membrane protein